MCLSKRKPENGEDFEDGYLFPGKEEGADCVRRGVKRRRTPEFNVSETCLGEELQLVPDRDRSAYSLRPGLGARRELGGQLLLEHDVGELDSSSGFEDTADLAECGSLVRREVDHPV